MGCIELCGGVHTAQRQTPTQIPIGFCVNLSVSVSVSVSVSSSVNSPLPQTEASHTDGRTLVQRVSQNRNWGFQGRNGFLPIKLENTFGIAQSERFVPQIPCSRVKVCLHVTFFSSCPLLPRLLHVIRIRTKWVHYLSCPLFTPSRLLQC